MTLTDRGQSASLFADLTALLRPSRVAVVGASEKPGSMGNSTYLNVRDHSRIAEVFPVNPGRETVCGDHAYPRVSDIPGDPMDVVIILVDAPRVVDVLRDCADARVANVMVFSSGFSEVGPEGRDLQEELLAVARSAGIRLYGPNSPGLANIADGVLLSMSPVASQDTLAGPVGLVTQGGGVGRALIQYMELGMGIGLWASPGNSIDLDITDFIHHMLLDDRIRVVGVVAEGIADGRKFVEVAKIAQRAGKPIVIMKIGRSEYGQQSAASHTASLAGDDAVADGVFAQHGVVRVDDVDELALTCSLFARCDSPATIGQVCVYSFSGGTSSHGADVVGAMGLKLARFGEETRQLLEEHAPSFGFVDNPVDITTQVFTDSALNKRMLGAIAHDPAVGSILFAMPADYGSSTVSVTTEALEVTASSDALLVPVWISPRRGGGFQVLVRAGLVPFPSVTSAVRAVKRIADWSQARSRERMDALESREAVVASPTSVVKVAADAMAPETATELLASFGLRFPRELVATDVGEAHRAWQAIGGPVAIKLLADGVLHKTDVGGVRLGVNSAEAVTRAWQEMCGPEAVARLGTRPRGVTVQEMIGEGVDLLLGAHNDEVFGPVLTFGAGGVFTEIERDVAHLSIPFSEAEFGAALETLRISKRIRGARGTAGADVGNLYGAAVALATCFAESREVSELEVNPLRAMPTSDGGACLALDVVALRRP